MKMKRVIKLKVNKRFILIIVLMCSSIAFTSCWNYREVEQLAIVAGTAIDRNEDGTIHITVEVVGISGDGQISYQPVYIEEDGDTFFEAARRSISLNGKRLYWSHAKVVIISQELAKEEISKYLDFLFRDAEAREDIWLLVSAEKTAGEILRGKSMFKPIVSFEIDDIMRSRKSISRFPYIEMFEFFDRLLYKQVSPILPAVRLNNQGGKVTPQIEGTAIFKKNKLTGFINAENTKSMLWLRDEVKGGLVIIKDAAGTKEDVTLEIFRSKSKITPVLQDGVLKIKADIDLNVNIGEVGGSTDFISSPGKKKLVEAAQKQLEKNIKDTYIMIRDTYNADVFGFGRRVEMKLPNVWNQIKNDWDQFFTELELDVKVKVQIRGSAATRIPLK